MICTEKEYDYIHRVCSADVLYERVGDVAAQRAEVYAADISDILRAGGKLQEQAGFCDAVRCHGGAVFAGVHCVCARRGYLLRHLIFKYIIYR